MRKSLIESIHTFSFLLVTIKTVKVGNDQEMAQIERKFRSINRGLGKNKMTLRYLYQENIS